MLPNNLSVIPMHDLRVEEPAVLTGYFLALNRKSNSPICSKEFILETEKFFFPRPPMKSNIAVRGAEFQSIDNHR